MSYDRTLVNRVSHNDIHVVCVCTVALNPRDWFELLCCGRNPLAFSHLYLPVACSYWPNLYVCAHGTLPLTALFRLLQRRLGPDVTKAIAAFIIGDEPNPLPVPARYRTVAPAPLFHRRAQW